MTKTQSTKKVLDISEEIEAQIQIKEVELRSLNREVASRAEDYQVASANFARYIKSMSTKDHAYVLSNVPDTRYVIEAMKRADMVRTEIETLKRIWRRVVK